MLWILFLLLLCSIFIFGFFVPKQAKKTISVNTETSIYTSNDLLDDLSQIQISQIQKKIKTILPKYIEEKTNTQKQINTEEKRAIFFTDKPQKQKEIALAYRGKRAKLVIIIDDVSSSSQLKKIQALEMNITPSIFPPSELSMSSHKLAANIEQYMIHLPMESSNAQFNTQYKTLKTTSTKEEIVGRAQELRRLFPEARYVNNHTGSVFTSNKDAMYMLYKALREEGFIFVDSRTSGASKVKKIAHSFNDAYVARDIFLDNIHEIPKIHKQLKQAVKIAQKKGYAIAIGHPHNVTMHALSTAKDILKEVELVYIDNIYKKSK